MKKAATALIAVLALAGLAGCGDEPDDAEHTVVYKVTSPSGNSTRASMTYTIDGGTTMEQVGDAPLPWSKTVKVKGKFRIVQVSAQSSGSVGQGMIMCAIDFDGEQVKTATSIGDGAIASCDYAP
jgi:ABC-type phosphate transport system substrate-binding protein